MSLPYKLRSCSELSRNVTWPYKLEVTLNYPGMFYSCHGYGCILAGPLGHW